MWKGGLKNLSLTGQIESKRESQSESPTWRICVNRCEGGAKDGKRKQMPLRATLNRMLWRAIIANSYICIFESLKNNNQSKK